jgi:hypothetical protein
MQPKKGFAKFCGRGFSRPLKNVGEAGKTRRKRPKKRSLRVVNEHFEAVFNAVLPTQVVFQRPVSRERLSRLKPLPRVYPVQRRSPDEIRGHHHLSRIASGLRGMHD